jgi:transcriptional regulator with XRE-family HTH domain
MRWDEFMDPRARERAECRRPIEDGEVPFLEALGARLLALRSAAGFTRWKLAQGAKLSENTIARIESGTRRTRGTTLERIAQALGTPHGAETTGRRDCVWSDARPSCHYCVKPYALNAIDDEGDVRSRQCCSDWCVPQAASRARERALVVRSRKVFDMQPDRGDVGVGS